MHVDAGLMSFAIDSGDVVEAVVAGVGGADGYYLRMSSDGKQILCAQQLAGSLGDYAVSVTTTSSGSAWVAGLTSSPLFPLAL